MRCWRYLVSEEIPPGHEAEELLVCGESFDAFLLLSRTHLSRRWTLSNAPREVYFPPNFTTWTLTLIGKILVLKMLHSTAKKFITRKITSKNAKRHFVVIFVIASSIFLKDSAVRPPICQLDVKNSRSVTEVLRTGYVIQETISPVFFGS